jgi:hypothetical protein
MSVSAMFHMAQRQALVCESQFTLAGRDVRRPNASQLDVTAKTDRAAELQREREQGELPFRVGSVQRWWRRLSRDEISPALFLLSWPGGRDSNPRPPA